MPWSAEQYHKFQSQRSAPFYDLLALVEVRPQLNVVDLGCGTGDLTRVLADSLPDSEVVGLDSSLEMLERAAHFAADHLHFREGDQAKLEVKWDLIFSNAALHWSEHHEELIPYLLSRLNPGGQICVQVPSNHNHISLLLIRETAREAPFNQILRGFERISPVLAIDQYARILFEQNMEDIIVFEKVYPHVLENSDAVVEWISGTALVPYFERLGDHKDDFLTVLRKKMKLALPDSPLLYPFRRTFFSAKRARGAESRSALVQ